MMTTWLANPRRQLALLIAVAILCSALNWLKLGSFWGDAPRSLFEIYRASIGEIPYKDFTWPYPPLPIAIFGLFLHWFGATFSVSQIGLDILSFACVLAVWLFARRLMPERVAFAATVAFTVVGATNGGNFALFSLAVYTPSILIGTLGLLLFGIGYTDYIRAGLTFRSGTLLTCGGFIGCLSRPECAAAMVFGMLSVGLIELRSRGQYDAGKLYSLAKVACLAFLPSISVYVAIIAWIGLHPLLRGVSAYGMATISCPWWPTGFGVIGAIAALAGAVAAFGVLRLFSARKAPWKKSHYVVISLAAASWLLYSTVFFRDLSQSQSTRQGLLSVAYYLISANTVLLPVMWTALALFLVEAVVLFRTKSGELPKDDMVRVFVLAIIFALSMRALFNNANSHATTVTPAVYPLLILYLPLLLQSVYRFQTMSEKSAHFDVSKHVFLLATVLLYTFAVIRLTGYCVRELQHPFAALQTIAGPVKLSDGGVSAKAYQFVLKNTVPGEAIADIAYGGGLNFALHRTSPLYTTQFTNFRPTADERERDYFQLRASHTRIVISREPPAVQYGSGYGCAFPALVWKAEGCSDARGVVFPLLSLIEKQYRPDERFGGITAFLYDPASGPAVSLHARGGMDRKAQ